MYQKIIKPFLDITIAIFLLFVLSPLFLLIYLLLYISMEGKPIFCQKRPGYQGKLFVIRKFRTMTNEKDISGELLPDANRLTPIGSFIRKTSMDELPQLFNILKGEMSFVGPRPLLIEYLPLYNDFQKQRHDVKPGITGWAQVNGRNAISWDKKFDYDVFYVQNCSFVLDLRIVGRTFKKVLGAEGISADGNATIEPFKGNHE
jgi:undecaprenyl phosphate N,N'-diacetylbacillosamine 1-phosphate transferase